MSDTLPINCFGPLKGDASVCVYRGVGPEVVPHKRMLEYRPIIEGKRTHFLPVAVEAGESVFEVGAKLSEKHAAPVVVQSLRYRG